MTNLTMLKGATLTPNADLTPNNAFRIKTHAKYLLTYDSVKAFINDAPFIDWQREKFLILGHGSNILFTGDFDGLVIKLNFSNKQIISETNHTVCVEVEAGADWDNWVAFAVNQGWHGLENLSYIPGTVGAAPVQNIGAYGVELENSLESVCVWDTANQTIVSLTREDCQFGYRESIFKQQPGRFVILAVRFLLKKHAPLILHYGTVKQDAQTLAGQQPLNLTHVRQAVINIRQTKLPDPKITPNAGSFFKNPVLPESRFLELNKVYPSIPSYPDKSGFIKIPAAWLIEQSGCKAFQEGDAAVHPKHALVLINKNQAKGHDILRLASKIQAAVKQTFGITLAYEVNII